MASFARLLIASLWISCTQGWMPKQHFLISKTRVIQVPQKLLAKKQHRGRDDFFDDFLEEDGYRDMGKRQGGGSHRDMEINYEEDRYRTSRNRYSWEEEDDYYGEDDLSYGDEEDDDYYHSIKEDTDKPEWEQAGKNSWVLLPPVNVAKPTAIVHFVGGTVFGSFPNICYETFLEGLVRQSNCTVVATGIPVQFTKNPLNHLDIAKQLSQDFDRAVSTVLEPEYGATIVSSRDGKPTVPIIALGHSLGSRLHAVMATSTKRNSKRLSASVFVSFTNHGAASVIPGLWNLRQHSAELKNSRRRKNMYYSDYDDDEGGLLEEAKNVLIGVQTMLTPKSGDLEFFPAPMQLWNAITEGNRYLVPKTLLVQFDDDEIDQSSQLANALAKRSSSDNQSDGSLWFSRLKGDHMLPISNNAGGSREENIFISTAIKQVIGTRRRRGTMDDLTKTVASFIQKVAAANVGVYAT